MIVPAGPVVPSGDRALPAHAFAGPALPLGLNPVLLMADPPADHLTFSSLDFIAPSALSCRLRL